MGGVQITGGGLSNVGRMREGNEDSFGSFEPPDPGGLAEKGRLFVVADGMGGEAAGEIASRIAVDVAGDAYFSEPFRHPVEALSRSLKRANQTIYDQARAEPHLRGMGTTCTALALWRHRVYLAHVGDTRAYVIREGRIVRLTEDHSLAARGKAFAHILTRALGPRSSVEVDLLESPLTVRRGDVFLLCSDGLWGQVADDEVRSIVVAEAEPQEACRRMVDLANERGGPDNITVQVIRIDGVDDGHPWLAPFRWLRDHYRSDLTNVAWKTRRLDEL